MKKWLVATALIATTISGQWGNASQRMENGAFWY